MRILGDRMILSEVSRQFSILGTGFSELLEKKGI